MNLRLRSASLFGTALALLSLTACGSGGGTGTVTGTIKSRGREIPRGLLTLIPDKGEPKSCAIIEGKFDTGPVPTGPYRVIIVLNELGMQQQAGGGANPENKGGIGEGLGAGDGKVAPKATKASKKYYVDPKYGDANTSGLGLEVLPGPNTYDKDLE